jgi:short subunit dehydrogenase-like uncharacterized protein
MSGVGLGAGAWVTAINPLSSGQMVRGVAAMANSANTFSVVYPTSVGTTNYVLQITISNLIDGSARHLVATITAKSATGFTFETQQNTNSVNYKVEYLLIKL